MAQKIKKNNFPIFPIILVILVILGIAFIYYRFNTKNEKNVKNVKKEDSNKTPIVVYSKKQLKMGESLEGISWNVKINSKLRGKAEPFKIVFDTDKNGHIEANQKTLDFLFDGKNSFNYTYQGSDLYHLIINNVLWQLSFTRINNDIIDENPSFINTDHMHILNTERI